MATNSPRNSLGNVRSDMDISYPEHLSRLNRHIVLEVSKTPHRMKRNNRPRNRYRTQPVTFDEIQEVDEETAPDSLEGASHSTSKYIEGHFPNILGSKRKKSKGDQKKYANSNGEASVEQKSIDQLRRMDRETSI